MKKLSDILEKLQSKYPDDKDVEMALELAPMEDELEMEDEELGMEEDMGLGLEEPMEEGMEEPTDELGLPLPDAEEGEEDMLDMEEEAPKKKKKASADMLDL